MRHSIVAVPAKETFVSGKPCLESEQSESLLVPGLNP